MAGLNIPYLTPEGWCALNISSLNIQGFSNMVTDQNYLYEVALDTSTEQRYYRFGQKDFFRTLDDLAWGAETLEPLFEHIREHEPIIEVNVEGRSVFAHS